MTKPLERWPGMSLARYRELGTYLRALANDLGLRDWTIHTKYTPLDEDGDDSDANAKTVVTYGRKHAMIYLARDFNRLPREEQRQTLIHELLHCHFDAIEVPLRSGEPLAFYIGEQQAGLLRGVVHERVELAVDGIAESIAPGFPLP